MIFQCICQKKMEQEEKSKGFVDLAYSPLLRISVSLCSTVHRDVGDQASAGAPCRTMQAPCPHEMVFIIPNLLPAPTLPGILVLSSE